MNKKEIIKLFGISDIDYSNNNIIINIWHQKFSDYIHYYNEKLCDLIKFNINFEGVKQDNEYCQNNLLLLSLLKPNTTINISTVYGLGEIHLEYLNNIKCTICLHMIDIFFNNETNICFNNIIYMLSND